MAETLGWIFNIQKYCIHDGPGIRTTVFLKGCPLRCRWCSNPESQSFEPLALDGKPDSRAYGVQEVLNICLKDSAFYEESGGGVTLSGGEPLCQIAFVLELLGALRARRVHTAIETTGHAPPEVFERAAQAADLLLFDMKHHDAARHKQGTGADNTLILRNLRSAVQSGRDVLPRIPVIPGFNDAPDDARAFARLLNSMGATRAQLLPFHQMGDKKYALLGKPYALRHQKPLYPEDLTAYQAAMNECGVRAFF